MTSTPARRTRLVNEQGTALIVALMAMMLLTALGAVVIMVSRTETAIANNYRSEQAILTATLPPDQLAGALTGLALLWGMGLTWEQIIPTL